MNDARMENEESDPCRDLRARLDYCDQRLRLRCGTCWKEVRKQDRRHDEAAAILFARELHRSGWQVVKGRALCPVCCVGGRDPGAPRRAC